MGAHVWGPAFLRDHLLPQLPAQRLEHGLVRRHAGLPLLHGGAGAGDRRPRHRPARTAWRSSSSPSPGSSRCRSCCWAFGRLARFRYPMPELFAFAGLCFALDESFSIYGGNLKSTMAGEFSFSIALTLDDPRARAAGQRDADRASTAAGRRSCSPSPCVCHGIVAIYVAHRRAGHRARRPRPRAPARGSARQRRRRASSCCRRGGSARSSATTTYMTDMKYGARPEGADDSFWDMFFPLTAPLDILVTTLAVIGFVACVARRHANGTALGVIGLLTVAARLPHPGQPAGHRAAVEPAAAAAALLRALPADDGRRRRARRPGRRRRGATGRPRDADRAGSPARSRSAASALVVLLVLGFMFEVLPGGGRRVSPRRQQGGVRLGPVPQDGDRRRRPGRRLVAVQLHRLRGPHRSTPSTTTSCRRWPSIGETNGLRPGDVGEQRGQRPVRHDDGADAAAALDRRLHRLDGGAVLRGVGHHAVPLPHHRGDVEAELQPGARAALRRQRRRRRRAATCRRSACAT